MTAALELRGIVKRFPGVVANDHVDLTVERGEIRAILGENGAGKTTLMRVLYGLEQPDEGEIHLHGRRQTFRSPLEAIRAGLGMVHQHFMLFPSLTVGENVVYGREPRRRGLIDRRTMTAQVTALAERYGLGVDAGARLGDLAVGVRQRVEILKTLYREARLLILDEPTTVLTPGERDGLFAILRRFAAEGKTVLFITHKLQEVMDLAGRATVLRRGRVTATVDTAQSSPEELGRLMVGRDVRRPLDRDSRPSAEVVLAVEDLTVEDEAGRDVVSKVSLEVRAGEIVGVAGVAGNGQSEVVAALAGQRPAASGRVLLQGPPGGIEGGGPQDQDITRATVAERRRAGLSYIPEDRNELGLALDASVADNLLLGFQQRPDLCRRGVLSRGGVRALAEELIGRFAIKGAPSAAAASLSGGHRQRLVVARELARESPLLLAEHPTQGIDVGAAENVLGWLAAARDAGRAVLWISSELAELLRLADRILVMFEGRLVADLPSAEASEERLGLLMAGGVEETCEEQPDA